MRSWKKKHPVLYEINTRVWLREISSLEGKDLTLAEVPEAEIERLADLGVDLVWLMGVWQVGPRSVEIARTDPNLVREYQSVLHDYTPEDVIGSPYAVAEYVVDPALGGTKAMVSLRGRLARKGMGLLLDFVPNHSGVDHKWITQHPEFYIQGDEEDLRREPGNYFQAETLKGKRILAHGRDPYFPGWTDTAQLNYFHPSARAALKNVLTTVAGQCDGVRCDMAMLVLVEVFKKTWGERALRGLDSLPEEEFWSEAVSAVRERFPGFIFLAEVYWGLEERLQSLGFDFTYDKTLYDHLCGGSASQVYAHLRADSDHQNRSVRFLENHDERRAAAALPGDRLRAALLIAAAVPGVSFLHEGQIEGRKVKLPVQLRRRPAEPIDQPLREFYERLLEALRDPVFRHGQWRLLPVRSAWDGNPTWENFVAFEWEAPGHGWKVVAVNFGPTRGQCYVAMGREAVETKALELADHLGEARYLRDGSELLRKGLYVDLQSFGFHLFDVKAKA